MFWVKISRKSLAKNLPVSANQGKIENTSYTHTHTHTHTHSVWSDGYVSLMVVIISQCKHISKYHIVHLKYITCLFVNYVFKSWLKEKNLTHEKKSTTTKKQKETCMCSVAKSSLTLQPHRLHQAPPSMGFPARKLEWVAISLARESSRPRDWTRVSCGSSIGRWIL